MHGASKCMVQVNGIDIDFDIAVLAMILALELTFVLTLILALALSLPLTVHGISGRVQVLGASEWCK